MRSFLGSVGLARWLGVAALATGLAACSTGNMFTPAPANAQMQNATPSQTELAQAQLNALPAIATECPPIRVREGGEALLRYVNNSRPSAREVTWQAVIDKQSRNCVSSNGKITVQMGVVGRVLLGPAGTASSTEVPLRFAIERDGAAVFSQVYRLPVQIDPALRHGEFVKVVENVDIPYLGGEQITIWVGFDPQG